MCASQESVMQGHEAGATDRWRSDRAVALMTMTSTSPHFRCNDVVLPLSGGSYYEMVEELRRTAWRHFEEELPVCRMPVTPPGTRSGGPGRR